MKAITFDHYGPADVLQLSEIARPEPTENEILIRVYAAEVTKTDCELRRFSFSVNWFWLPLRMSVGLFRPRIRVLGGYFAGTVVAVGRDVSRFQPGDQVFGCTRLKLGAHGEYLCLPEHYTIVTKPHNLSFEQAAAVPLGGLNALHYMRLARIQPGEQVLINGAGGSIGSFALQIAKTMGAEVTAVDIGYKADMLREAGADHVINYKHEYFADRDKQYDVIFDMVAASRYSDCIRCLKPGGRYLLGNPRLSSMIRAFITSWFSDKTVQFAFANEREEELMTLKSMLEAEQIKPFVDRVYQQAQAVEAHRRVETEERVGIVVLKMNG